jgi:hypothetical protein
VQRTYLHVSEELNKKKNLVIKLNVSFCFLNLSLKIQTAVSMRFSFCSPHFFSVEEYVSTTLSLLNHLFQACYVFAAATSSNFIAKNGCVRSCSALGRCSGSVLKHCSSMSLSSSQMSLGQLGPFFSVAIRNIS